MFKRIFLIVSLLFFNINIKAAESCSYVPQSTPGNRLWNSSLALQGQVIAIAIESEI